MIKFIMQNKCDKRTKNQQNIPPAGREKVHPSVHIGTWQ